MALDGIAQLNRRQFGKAVGAVSLAALANSLPAVSLAANPTETELFGLSAFGNLKYTEDSTALDYVNPDAPKGGTFAFSPSYWYFNQNVQTFDTLNSFVLKGSAPPRMELCFDMLMAPAIDEPDAHYGLVAKSVVISADRNTYRFALRPEARFHDGSAVTAADVAFSYSVLKESGHPDIALILKELVEAVAVDKHTVELRFSGKQSDRTILNAVIFPILSKTWYEGREFKDSSMDVPLSSGPWKPGKFSAGRFIEYVRVKDWWAKDLLFGKGLNNFDTLRIEFFRERQAAFEAFKKGDIFWREEFTSKVWATEYNFPALQDGHVKKQLFPAELRPSMQGWAVNTRRKKFADPRTREAIGLCFDFEWTNESLFFGAYTRSDSLFERSNFRATGTPAPEEMALLESLRGKVPENVFGQAIVQPRSNGSGRDRKLLRKAVKLLSDAGWKRQDGKLVSQDGEVLSIEFLIRSPTFERILSKYVESLKAIGAEASIRLVDPSQFQRRLDEFDFDLVGIAFSLLATPTAESLEQFFASKYASVRGSRNLPGIQSPEIDKLIEAVAAADIRTDLETAIRALDRVLRSMHYWIPNWYSANHRVAFWDMFGFKEPKPDYHFPVEQLWWFDETKAKAIGKA
ncbi:MAG: extracellular solute-binding protein [Pseudomonadota bacterium]